MTTSNSPFSQRSIQEQGNERKNPRIGMFGPFANLPLRSKLIASFVFIALIGAISTYVSHQISTKRLIEDALPSLQAFGQIAWQSRAVQAEAFEFVSTSQEESLNELSESVAKLTTLGTQVTSLADDSDEADSFAALAKNANEIANLAQILVQSHAQTLAALEIMEASEETMETLFGEAQTVIDEEIARNIAFEDIEELEKDAIPSQALLAEFSANAQLLLSEALEFVTTGKATTVGEFEEAKDRLDVAQSGLATVLEADEPGEVDLGVQLDEVKNEIESVGQAVIESHTQTLALMEQFEEAESELNNSLTIVEELVNRDVRAGIATTNRVTIIAAVMGIAISVTLGFLFSNTITQPISRLVKAAQQLGGGNLSTDIQVETSDEIGTLGTAFNDMASQLRLTLGELDQRVHQMKTSSEVSHYLSTILDPTQLATAVVEQLQTAFNYYHVHIYLLDEGSENLVMAGGTGEAGREMLANGHRIPISQGLVGQAAITNTPILIPNVSQEKGWLPNPLLPDTKAEVAVPISHGDQIMGVLDVQQNVANGLSQTDVELLESIASQVAIGLQNAALFEQREEALASIQEEQERVQGILGSLITPIVISSITDGIVLYVNEPMAETIQISREALIGEMTPDFYVNIEDRETFLAAVRQNGFVDNYELQLKRSDGELFWSLVSARIINYQGAPALLASLIDIDDRKQAQVLLSKQANKLNKQANELATVARVSIVTATILDSKELLQEVVDLTKSSFDLYHAHIHLLNDNKDRLILTAGAGDVGREMVAEGRDFPLAAAESLVATVARAGQGAIRNYETVTEGFMPHPLLAKTRSEMAVPIALGEEVLGVLDVRSDVFGYFGESDMQTLTTLALQVAVALQNARSFEQSQRTLQDLDVITRRLTHEGWEGYLETAVTNTNFIYGSLPDDNENGIENKLTLPLNVQGATIGQITLTEPQTMGDEAASIANEVAQRLSAHIENLRLTEQTEIALAESQRQSEELTLINRVVSDVASSLNIQQSMQIVVEELAAALQLQQIRIALINDERTESRVVAERFDPTKTSSAMGYLIPLVDNVVTNEVLKIRRPVIIKEPQHDPRMAHMHDLLREQGIETLIILPMIAGNEVIGTVGIDLLVKDRTLSDAQINLAQTIIYQASTAVQNARLFQQTQAALSTTQQLYSASQSLATAQTEDEVIAVLLENLDRSNLDRILIVIIDQNESEELTIVVKGMWDRDNLLEAGNKFSAAQLPIIKDLGQTDTFFIENVATSDTIDEITRATFQFLQVQSVAAIPIGTGQKLYGWILIETVHSLRKFTTDSIQTHLTLARQAAIVLESVLAFEETKKRTEELAILNEMSRAMTAQTSIDGVVQTVYDHLSRLMDTTNFYLVLYEEESDEVVFVLNVSGDNMRWYTERRQAGEGLTEYIIRHRQPLLMTDNIDQRLEQMGIANYGTPAESWLGAPLMVGDERVLGVIGLQSDDTPYLYNEQHLNLLTAVTNQAAIAIESVRAFQETNERARELDLINRTAQAVSQHLELTQLLETIYEQVVQIMPVDAFVVATYDPSKHIVNNLLVYDDGLRYPESTQTPSTTNETYQIVQTGEPILLNRTADEVAQRMGELSTLPDSRLGGGNKVSASLLYVPLTVGSDTIGSISVQSYEYDVYTQKDVDLLAGVANHVAVAMANAQLFTQAEERAEEMAILNQVAQVVAQQLEPHQLFQAVHEQILRAIPNDTFFVATYDADQKLFHFPYMFDHGELKDASPMEAKPDLELMKAVDTGKPIVINRISEGLKKSSEANLLLGNKLPTSMIFVPLRLKDEVMGVISIQNYEYHAYSQTETALLNGIANHMAVAMENVKLFTQAEERAEELAIINQVARVVSQQLESEQLFRAVHEQIQRVMPSDTFFVASYDAKKELFTFPYMFDDGELRSANPMAAKPKLELTKVVKNSELIIWNRSPEEMQQLKNLKLLVGHKSPTSMVFVPLQLGGQTWGAISVQNYEFHSYTQSEADLLFGIANHMAVALENIRLFSEAQRRAEREAMINAIGQKIQSAPTVQGAMQTAVFELGQALKLKKAIAELAIVKQENGHK